MFVYVQMSFNSILNHICIYFVYAIVLWKVSLKIRKKCFACCQTFKYGIKREKAHFQLIVIGNI